MEQVVWGTSCLPNGNCQFILVQRMCSCSHEKSERNNLKCIIDSLEIQTRSKPVIWLLEKLQLPATRLTYQLWRLTYHFEISIAAQLIEVIFQIFNFPSTTAYCSNFNFQFRFPRLRVQNLTSVDQLQGGGRFCVDGQLLKMISLFSL